MNIINNFKKMWKGELMTRQDIITNKYQRKLSETERIDRLTRSFIEPEKWYQNDIRELKNFYSITGDPFFWNNSCFNKKDLGFKEVHFPIASTLLNTKYDLILNKNFNFEFKNEESNEIVKNIGINKKTISEIFKIRDIYGSVAIKLQMTGMLKSNGTMENTEIKLVPYNPLEFKVETDLEGIKSISFFTKIGDKTLIEEYGHGYINYTVYKDDNEININEVDENLENIVFSEDVFPALLLTTNNKNQYDINNILGKSIFDGLYSMFDEIDQTFSINSKEELASMTNKDYSVQSLVTIKSGENIQQRPPSKYTTNFATFTGTDNSLPITSKSNFDYETRAKKLEQLITYTATALGISSQSLGLNNSGANASGEAKQLDEKLTLRMRKNEIEDLTNGIIAIANKIKDISNIFNLNILQNEDITEDIIKFPEYEEDDKLYKTKIVESIDKIEGLSLELKTSLIADILDLTEDDKNKLFEDLKKIDFDMEDRP